MEKIKKGQYGYRNSFKKKQLFKIGLLAAFILIQLGSRLLTDSQSVKNVLTVMAVVTVLPMANLASPYVAIFKYRTPARDFYEKMQPYEQKSVILYDLVITTKDDVMPMDAVAVHPTGVYAYCINSKIHMPAAEKALNETFVSQRLDPNLKLTTDLNVFEKRLRSLKPASEYEDDGSINYGVQLLKSMSM